MPKTISDDSLYVLYFLGNPMPKVKKKNPEVRWIGPCIDRKSTTGGVEKKFYSAFESEGMKVAVGNFVLLHSPKTEPLPYVGRVQKMWQTNSAPDAQFVRLIWYWRFVKIGSNALHKFF